VPYACEPESVNAQLDRIVNGPPLASSPSLCRFLRFVVEETLAGRQGSLKEYSLGVVVFDRGDAFDPRMDPIVRVQARNLRVRLAQYYAGPGMDDPVLIELPKRTYVPVFRRRIEEAPAAEPVASLEPAAAVHDVTPAVTPTAVSVVAAPESPLAERANALAAEPFAEPLPVPAPAPVGEPVGGIWHRPRWASVGAAALLAIVAISAFWQVRPAETALKPVHEPDPMAQDLYIRGRYLMDRQTEPGLRESIDAFSRAVDRDPQFAPAYAGLADAYNVLAQFGYIPPKEGMDQARRAADRALAIDPALAEGHVSLAAIIEAYDWNWAAAEHEYRRALELNPALPEAHLWYGMFLRDQGRLQEALPEIRRAAQLEPFSVFTAVNLAHAYMMAGNYVAAEEQAHHAAGLAPDMVTAEVLLSNAYRAQSRTAEADAALDRAGKFSTGNPHALSVLACAYARHGQRDKGIRLFEQMELLAKQRYVSPFDLGSVSLVLGDEKRALVLLEEAYRQRSAGLIFLRDAKFTHSHSSPGFDSLIEKMHFAG
jgi:tetratricopeptide (TPR) repeat protein